MEPTETNVVDGSHQQCVEPEFSGRRQEVFISLLGCYSIGLTCKINHNEFIVWLLNCSRIQPGPIASVVGEGREIRQFPEEILRRQERVCWQDLALRCSALPTTAIDVGSPARSPPVGVDGVAVERYIYTDIVRIGRLTL